MTGSPYNLDEIRFELDPFVRLHSPLLQSGLAIWHGLAGGRAMPARRDLDPTMLPPCLLPHVLLIDVEYQPCPRFRWRLIGTHITNTIGRDSTGRYWDELYDQATRQSLSTGPLWVLKHRRPVRTLGKAPVTGRSHLRSENIDLPLSSNGRDIDMLLVFSSYD